MGLHKVSYNIGWTAWLDIAPHGVNKATALERVRGVAGHPRVQRAGGGRRAQRHRHAPLGRRGGPRGRDGAGPDEVLAVANETTATDLDDGVALVLSSL